MWKRFQTSSNKAPRQPRIGSPTLVETTLEEQTYPHLLEANKEGSPYKEIPSGRDAQPRVPPKGLPTLPPSPNLSLLVQDSLLAQDLTHRPASSIYSEPSPNPQVTQFALNVPRDIDVVSVATPTTTYTADVSPPSSPEPEPTELNFYYQRDSVSPIEEDPEPPYTSKSDRGPLSNIPVLKREKRSDEVENIPRGPMARNRQEQDVRRNGAAPKYDPYTGEPTKSERGKPQYVKPSAFNPGDAPVRGYGYQGLGTTTHITSVPRPQTSFSDRVRRLKESNIMTGNRPEWKGASGRQTVMKPVAEKPSSSPTVPARSPSRGQLRQPSPNGSSGRNTPASIALSDYFETSHVSHTVKGPTPTLSPPIPERDSRRSPSSNVGASTSQVSLRNPTTASLRSNQPSPGPDNSNRRLEGQYSTLRNELSTSTADSPLNGVKGLESIEHSFQEALKEVGIYEQPPSRFSVTTYATSTSSNTPRVSIDIPPVPTPPIQQSSILNRKRPQIGPVETAKATSRKPVGSPRFVSMTMPSERNSKSLPKTPGEAQSVDLVGSLQAQLDNLAQRRQNIQKSIRQMTELMPADVGIRNSVIIQRRDQERKKVEDLKEDLADVQAQEHELGLKLHRAWKRRDQDAVYEPTGLWVRRVTG